MTEAPRVHSADGRRGFALVAVLLVLAFISIIGAEFAYSMRLEATAARVYKETLIATHLAEAGIEQAIRELVGDVTFVGLGDPNDADTDKACPIVFYTSARVALKRLPHKNVPLGGGQFSYCISDEEGRLNINRVAPPLVARLLETLGVERADRDAINDAIQDWRDPNEEHRLNGAESEDYYLKLPVPYRSKNAQFDSIAELIQVKGVTTALMEGREGKPGLASLVAVRGPGSQVNINTAPREVLKALGMAEAQITTVEQNRRQGPIPPGTGGIGGLRDRTETFRIEAEGLIDGQVRARVTAIVNRKQTGEVTFLEWSGVR